MIEACAASSDGSRHVVVQRLAEVGDLFRGVLVDDQVLPEFG